MGVEPLRELYGRFNPGLVSWVVGEMNKDCFDCHDNT